MASLVLPLAVQVSGSVFPTGGVVCRGIVYPRRCFIDPILWETVGVNWNAGTIYGWFSKLLSYGLWPRGTLPSLLLYLPVLICTPVRRHGIVW